MKARTNHDEYERLATARDRARAEHLAAEEVRDRLARVIANMVAERPDRIVTQAVPDYALTEYRDKCAEATRLRDAWFDARDEVETYMGRPVTRR